MNSLRKSDSHHEADPSIQRRRRNSTRWFLASLPILGLIPFFAIEPLPLLVRATSAILCGLAVLLCGAYLLGHAIDRLSLAHAEEST